MLKFKTFQSEKYYFVAVRLFPSPEVAVFAAVTNYFFQFMLPLLVLVFIYAHIAVVLFMKSRKNTLTEVQYLSLVNLCKVLFLATKVF